MKKVAPFVVCFILIFNSVNNESVFSKDKTVKFDSYSFMVYQNIIGKEFSFQAFDYAYAGYLLMEKNHMLNNDSLITIIDYSKPSNEERLYIIDLKNCRVREKSLVAHGKATGDLLPQFFSNSSHSHKSSLGFFITDEVYTGKNGYSLKLKGVEKNINDNAERRLIVFHGADYVSFDYLNEFGRLGRSFGCPALPINKNQEIIDLIKDKSCVFIYYPANEYFSSSQFISQMNSL